MNLDKLEKIKDKHIEKLKDLYSLNSEVLLTVENKYKKKYGKKYKANFYKKQRAMLSKKHNRFRDFQTFQRKNLINQFEQFKRITDRFYDTNMEEIEAGFFTLRKLKDETHSVIYTPRESNL